METNTKSSRVLSYSSMKTLQNCESEYWHYKIAKTPHDSDYEDSNALGLGKAFHEVLEKTMHKRFSEEFLVEAMQEHNVGPEDMPLLTGMLKKYVQLHKLSGLTVVKCELAINHHIYVGFIDMIMTDEQGGWWLGDLKTTSRFDEALLPRLPKDMQMNLYAYFAESIGPMLQLDPAKFKGCRYRAVTKPKLKQTKHESVEAYTLRLEKSCQVYDIEIPVRLMNPKAAWDMLVDSQERVEQLHDGEVPKKNYNNCISYFKPCKYFSQCHGHIFSEGNNKVKVHTIESFEESDVL